MKLVINHEYQLTKDLYLHEYDYYRVTIKKGTRLIFIEMKGECPVFNEKNSGIEISFRNETNAIGRLFPIDVENR